MGKIVLILMARWLSSVLPKLHARVRIPLGPFFLLHIIFFSLSYILDGRQKSSTCFKHYPGSERRPTGRRLSVKVLWLWPFPLPIRRANFVKVVTTILELCAGDITKAKRRYSFTKVTHTACCVASSSARACSLWGDRDRQRERERERERNKVGTYVVT